jgi:hypothetical protein
VDAANDIPRRHWSWADPTRTTGRLVFSALTVFRRTIAQGRYSFSRDPFGRAHAELRMVERSIELAELLECVARGRVCTVGLPRDWIGGAYLYGETLVIVGAPWPSGTDFADLTPQIGTVYTVDAIEPEPLTMPLSAFVAGASAVSVTFD